MEDLLTFDEEFFLGDILGLLQLADQFLVEEQLAADFLNLLVLDPEVLFQMFLPDFLNFSF